MRELKTVQRESATVAVPEKAIAAPPAQKIARPDKTKKRKR